jgi:hypothetical protein
MELREGKLALGLGFGVNICNTAWNELIAADPNDIQLMNNPTTAVLPTFSLGTCNRLFLTYSRFKHCIMIGLVCIL